MRQDGIQNELPEHEIKSQMVLDVSGTVQISFCSCGDYMLSAINEKALLVPKDKDEKEQKGNMVMSAPAGFYVAQSVVMNDEQFFTFVQSVIGLMVDTMDKADLLKFMIVAFDTIDPETIANVLTNKKGGE